MLKVFFNQTSFCKAEVEPRTVIPVTAVPVLEIVVVAAGTAIRDRDPETENATENAAAEARAETGRGAEAATGSEAGHRRDDADRGPGKRLSNC